MTHRRAVWASVIAAISMLVATAVLRLHKSARSNSGEEATHSVEGQNEELAWERAGREAEASIAGRVTRAGDGPVAGALVCATAGAEWMHGTASSRCTTSEADGRYRLTDLGPLTYEVNASLPHYLPVRWKNPEQGKSGVQLRGGEAREGIDLVLVEGGVEVRGRVKDIAGGVIVGARVRVHGMNSPSDEPGGDAFTESDARGEWTLWAAPGRIGVVASVAGYTDAWGDGIAPGQFIELAMTPESVLQGRVVEAGTDTPVAGAQVSVGDGTRFLMESTPRQTATSDAEGRFRISRLEPGRYKPEAKTSRAWGAAAESVILGLAETSSEVRIEVHPTATASGRVVFDDGRPCKEGHVTATDQGTADRHKATIREGGQVRIEQLLAGTYDIHISCQGASTDRTFDALVVADRDVDGLTWKVPAGFKVRGVVVDGAGRPAGGETTFAFAKRSGPRARQLEAYGKSGPDGTFELQGLAPAVYAMRVIRDAMLPTAKDIEVNVDRDRDDVRLTVPSASKDGTGTLEGKMVDRAGAPVARASVTARGQREGWGTANTIDDGTFVIKDLRAGEYRIGCDGDEQGIAATIRPNQTARVKLVVESRRGEIEGRVLEEGGSPVTDAFVEAERDSGAALEVEGEAERRVRQGWGRGGVLTDVDGKFTLTKLSPGSYAVRAYRKGGGDAVVGKVRVGTFVVLRIHPTASLSGMVVTSDGKPPERFVVEARDDKTGVSRKEAFFHTAGTFALRDLPAGNFRLTAEGTSGRAETELRLAQGENRQGVRLQMDSNTSLRGQVVSRETGEPLPGVRVIVQAAKGASETVGFRRDDPDQRMITDAQGRFEVAKSPVGRVIVNAFPGSMEYGHLRMPFTLETRPSNELPPLRMPRRRLQDSDRAGDFGYLLLPSPPGTDLEERRWTVGLVVSGGPAAKAGLQIGDEITSVDGQDVTGINGYLYTALTLVPEGTSAAFGLRRGETISIKAERRH